MRRKICNKNWITIKRMEKKESFFTGPCFRHEKSFFLDFDFFSCPPHNQQKEPKTNGLVKESIKENNSF